MTPFEIDDVEALVRERQLLGLALDELDVRGAHLRRRRRAPWRASRASCRSRSRALLGPTICAAIERVGAGAGAEVEHTLARREPAELPGVGDAGERLDGRVGHVRELGAGSRGPRPRRVRSGR